MLAADVVTRVSIRLNDQTNTTWTQSMLLKWLNSAQRAIVAMRPDACTFTNAFVLVAGTKQALPASALRLIKLTRNMGADGATPGNAIREIDEKTMNQSYPDWHTGATLPASAVVEKYIYDGRLPKVFWVVPPQPAAGMGYVEGIFSQAPADCTMNGVDGSLVDSNLSIDDIYEPALMEAMMYLALDQETTARSAEKAGAHLQAFLSMVGSGAQTDVAYGPKSPERPATIFQNG